MKRPLEAAAWLFLPERDDVVLGEFEQTRLPRGYQDPHQKGGQERRGESRIALAGHPEEGASSNGKKKGTGRSLSGGVYMASCGDVEKFHVIRSTEERRYKGKKAPG